MRELYYSDLETPVGRLWLAASPRGLAGVFRRESETAFLRELRERLDATGVREEKAVAEAAHELESYFSGGIREFRVPLDLSSGTPFQQRVWRTLRKIPHGETRSYKWVASRVGTEGYRAVGNANNRNPLMIVVPCHRVVSEDGGLGGYGCGLPVKRKLLRLEGAAVSRPRPAQ